MNDIEKSLLEKLRSNVLYGEYYERMMKIFAEQDQSTSILYRLMKKLHSPLSCLMYYWARTDEKKALIRKYEVRAIDYYQRALEHNYEILKQYKETGEEPVDFEYLIMTVDKQGNPKKTRVIDVKDGDPVFEDGCEIKDIWHTMNKVRGSISELSKWLDQDGTLQEKLEKALKLKEQGPLGGETPPSPNYDTSGMTREQSDAQAWQNYAIEMGMVRVVNYDYSLKELIPQLEKCIEFYQKAISIV